MSAVTPIDTGREFADLSGLLDTLATRGVRLSLSGDRRRVKTSAPAGAITPDLAAAIRSHRRELLAALTATPAPAREGLHVCAWGRGHLAHWRYSAGERRYVCTACFPELAGKLAREELARNGRQEAGQEGEELAPDRRRQEGEELAQRRRVWIERARQELAAWGEAHTWERLAIAYSAPTHTGARVPFAWVMPGESSWRCFLAAASGPDLAAVYRAAGLAGKGSGGDGGAASVVSSTRASGSHLGSSQVANSDGAAPTDSAQEAGQEREARTADPRDWPETFAALDTEALWIAPAGAGAGATPTRYELDELSRPDGATARRLVELAERHGITQLWLHPTWATAAGLPGRPMTQQESHSGVSHAFAAGEWATDASPAGVWGMQRPGHVRPWMKFYRRGEAGSIALAVPHLDPRAPWHKARDGRELLAAILAYREALAGFAYRSGPGATGTGLIRALHRGNKTALDLSASSSPLDFPAPARVPALTPQLGWLRELTAEERERGRYVHGYDKNAMFLAACSSLRCGFGRPAHLSAEGETAEELAAVVQALTDMDTRPRPARPVGYALARVTFGEGEGASAPAWSGMLPHPCYTGPKQADPAAEWQWYPAPTLVLAAEVGARVDVREAFVWGETHEPLEPWYQRLRTAREELASAVARGSGDSAPALALAAVKATYTQGIGWLDASWLRKSEEAEDLYRPDWRHAAIATANANLWRNLANVYAACGRAPFAILTDAAYFVSDSPDPLADVPAALRMGEGLGQFKVHLAAFPLADLAPVWAYLAAGREHSFVVSAFARAIADREE